MEEFVADQNAFRMEFSRMVRLGDLLDAELETAGREGRTSAEDFAGREGYSPDFLAIGLSIYRSQPAAAEPICWSCDAEARVLN